MIIDRPDHERAPFFDGLLAYRDAGIVPFSTPGHKGGRGAPAELVDALGAQALALDIPQGGGVDDTHRTMNLLRQAESLAADAWDAADAAFLVNGSSTGNIAMLLATCKPGDTVLVARNLHTSVLSGLILSGARPVYLQPFIHTELNLTLDIPVECVATALEKHPDAKAVMLVSPAYTGVTSDLYGIAAVCRERHVPLFVDEAWGPHFPFHPALPDGAIQSGASGGVTSIHKLLAGLTQASLMTFDEQLLRYRDVAPAISLIETTSPSALVPASIDVTRRQMALHGEALLERTLELAWEARKRIASIPNLQAIGPDILDDRPGAGFDPTRIMIDTGQLGITGFNAEKRLRDRYRIGVEMSDLSGVIVHITIGDAHETVAHLIHGLTALAREADAGGDSTDAISSSSSIMFSSPPAMTPREAALGPVKTVLLEDSAGEIAAEIITPYPPGIPLVAPGEPITPACIDYLKAGRDAGLHVSGPADTSLRTVRIVDR